MPLLYGSDTPSPDPRCFLLPCGLYPCRVLPPGALPVSRPVPWLLRQGLPGIFAGKQRTLLAHRHFTTAPQISTELSELQFLRYLLGSASHVLTMKDKLLLAGVYITIVAEIHGGTARSSLG